MAKKFFIVAVLCLAGAFPLASFASDLSIYPNTGTFEVGQRITVKVRVSGDIPPNAISAQVSVPTSIFSVDSVSKSGSILNFWVTEPTFSKSAGTVKFEGVVFNGFHGSVGDVATIIFHANKVGTAKISFQSGQILANDGEGTDITNNLNSATFTIVPATLKPQEPKVEIPIPEVIQPEASLTSPEIQEGLKYGEPAVFGMSKYPNADVLATFISVTGVKVHITGLTDENGDFVLLVPRSLKRGFYNVTAIVITEKGVHSYPSNQITIKVGNLFSDIGWDILSAMIIILILLIYLLIRIYFHLRVDRVERLVIKKGIRESLNVLHESFNLLKEDVSVNGSGRGAKIDAEQITNLKKDLNEAESLIKKEIKNI